MTLTILSARYANPDHTAAEIITQERGAVLISAADTPDAWEDLGRQVGDVTPYEPPPAPLRAELYKTEIIDRMTDGELEVFEAALSAAPLRDRMMWRDCVTLVAHDPLFGKLRAQMQGAFGAGRAAAILSLEV